MYILTAFNCCPEFYLPVYESPDIVLDPLRQASDELQLLEVNILINLNV